MIALPRDSSLVDAYLCHEVAIAGNLDTSMPCHEWIGLTATRANHRAPRLGTLGVTSFAWTNVHPHTEATNGLYVRRVFFRYWHETLMNIWPTFDLVWLDMVEPGKVGPYLTGEDLDRARTRR